VLDEIVLTLTREGWLVEAEGFRVRQPGCFRGSVTSGVDWFDLDGQFDYGDGVFTTLPDLLRAVREGQNFVRLSDGSRGMLPEQWLARFAALAELGTPEGAGVRFRNSQAALLDALLAAQDNVSVDQAFSELRDKLRSFTGIQPQAEPQGFSGDLRQYQREGLGWMDFLQSFRLGGCLADDMGLGKTVQVLALLERRRAGGEAAGPSLIVVPRSLVFNWIDEAARFTPQITIRNYTGLLRKPLLDDLQPGDVLVTTYGTLRRDILKLKEIAFDYAILDESQAIKNANSPRRQGHPPAQCPAPPGADRHARREPPRRTLVAVRIPQPGNARPLHRVSKVLEEWARRAGESRTVARRAGAFPAAGAPRKRSSPNCPKKTEQTLYCELDRQERKAYDQLRKYYREALQKKIDAGRLNQSKIQVLEALLRLRQAACHRGLLDPTHAAGSSAKLETLLEQLAEILAEGHKALVFSQFTSLLAIVREHLDRRGIVYEYLDGGTTNRGAKVRRFQEDADCPLFLISLKAGGHGLNLTAADYVFILDPWWNPAVEAQAVDPGAPDWPNSPRLRLPDHRPRHRRGKNPRTPGIEAQSRRGDYFLGRQPDPALDGRGPATPAQLNRPA
jgi:superfamily II DNA or RNA helicase